jgi:hypothetical protein
MKDNYMPINWKKQLRSLEKKKEWDTAIVLMQSIITEHPDNMDAYICMNYLLMNLLGEEQYDETKFNHYQKLTQWFFEESYAKFSDNAEYLYITSKTAVMGEWFFGIDDVFCDQMIVRAQQIDSINLLYKESYYWNLRRKDPKNPELIAYAHMILSKNSPIEEQLKDRGAVGEYLLELKRGWAENVLYDAAKSYYEKI